MIEIHITQSIHEQTLKDTVENKAIFNSIILIILCTYGAGWARAYERHYNCSVQNLQSKTFTQKLSLFFSE